MATDKDLIFGDESIRSFPTLEHVNKSTSFVDVSSGLLLYSKDYWFGFSAHHINQPHESLIQEEAALPVKYSLHGGKRIELKSDPFERYDSSSLVFAFNYKAQEKFD